MRSAVLLLPICAFLLVAESWGAEYELHPSLAISEEYTDNVFETETNRREDYITRVLPGLVARYKAPVWDWNVGYAFDYRYYARNSRTEDTTHDLSAQGLVRVIDEFLFLDLNDQYQRVSLDVARDVTRESLFINQSDRNLFTVSPYILLRPGQLQVRAGYRYVNTWYKEPTGIDKAENVGFAEIAYLVAPGLTVSSGYTYADHESSLNDFTRHDLYCSGRYEYGNGSFITGQVGNDWISYSPGPEISDLVWNGGVTHVFDSLKVSFNVGASYHEDPQRSLIRETAYDARLENSYGSTTAGVFGGYAEFEDPVTETVTTRRYGGGIYGRRELLTDLTGTLGFTGEKFDRKDLGTETRKFQVDAGIGYLLAEGLTLSLKYQYIDTDSPGIATDNWNASRATIEARKVF